MVSFKNNGKLKLLIIVGTRPEIIRLSAVINKCRKYFDTLLAHTGQNYDYTLNGIFFRDLKLRGIPYQHTGERQVDLGTYTCKLDGSEETVEAELKGKIFTIGEKLSIRRFEKASGECVVSYLHGGGRIGVVVAADGAGNDASVKEALTNVAMQIAAMSPKFIADSDVDQSYIDHETEILKAQMDADPKEAAKPENVKQGIIKGRVNKLLKDVVLLDQVYVRAEDGKQSVAQYLATVSKDLKLTKFVRFEVGEGMEKKNEDFAAEVAAQMNA